VNINEAFELDGKKVSILCNDGQALSGEVYGVETEEDEPEAITVRVSPEMFVDIELGEIASYEVL